MNCINITNIDILSGSIQFFSQQEPKVDTLCQFVNVLVNGPADILMNISLSEMNLSYNP